MNDLKYCPVCARYDWWYQDSLHKGLIKIKKRKGVEYLTLTEKGMKEGMKDGQIPKIQKKDWDKKVKLMTTPKLTVKEFKTRYIEAVYIRNSKTGVVKNDTYDTRTLKIPKKRKAKK